MIVIHEPIWNAHTGRREVGLAVHKLYMEKDPIEVMIDKRRKDGTLIYPNIFHLAKVKVREHRQEVRHGVRLAIIPIDVMTEVIVR